MRSSTTSIFSLSCFSQARILYSTVLLLSVSLSAIAPPKSASAIAVLRAANLSSKVSTKPSVMLAQAEAAQSSQRMLYVNPSEGKDSDNGSDRAPFKTITHALKSAQPGTTLLLAPGTYSAETGEIFPLVLKAKVTLQGDPATRGQETIIQGGGTSTNPAFGRSLTIEITAQATLNGVTVTNPQGSGVGIGSGSPLITNSTFTQSSYGLMIMGDSTALIQNNYFYQNRAAGIEISGIAQPTIQDNIFEQTGSAVIVGDRAAPIIANNRITQNQNGMVLQGSAQPRVRNNSVEGNRQYGLLAKDRSRPDLGTADNPGKNFFRNNGLSDVNVEATNQVISAIGNEWLNAIGALDTTLQATTSSDSAAAFPRPSALSSNPPTEPPRPMQIVQIATPSTPVYSIMPPQAINSAQATSNSQPSSKSLSFKSVPVSLKSLPLKPSPVATLPIPEPSFSPAPVQNVPAIALPTVTVTQNIEVTAPLETFPQPPSTTPLVRPILTNPAMPKPVQGNQLAPSSTIAATPISIPVPPPETIALRPDLETKSTRSDRAGAEIPKVSKNSTTLLPVPSSNIPLGKIGEMPSVYSMRGAFQPSFTQNTMFSASKPPISTIRFRVVVTVTQAAEQAQVLALVPDAFLIASTNNSVMQVGAFSDRTKAEQLAQTLASQGISSTIEPMNR